MSVLHPRHKLTYFKGTGWEPDWIDMAEGTVCTEFKRSYTHSQDDAEAYDVMLTAGTPSVEEVCHSALCFQLLNE